MKDSVTRFRFWRALPVVLSLAIAGSAVAAKVYKWVDENGDVHFGDRPTRDNAKELEIKVREPAAPAPVPGQPLPPRNQVRTNISDVMEEERLRRKEAREKDKQARESRQRNCVLARDKLRSFQESDYLYDIDSSGKRRVLSKAERAAAERDARDDVTRFCS